MTRLSNGVNVGRRYAIVPLRNNGLLAFDAVARNGVQLLTKSPAADGLYELAVSGSLWVKGSRITEVSSGAICTGYALRRLPGGMVVATPRFPLRGGKSLASRPAILDLADGRLLLRELTRVSRLSAQDVESGKYVSQQGSVVQVLRGRVAGAASGSTSRSFPDFQQFEDFAP